MGTIKIRKNSTWVNPCEAVIKFRKDSNWKQLVGGTKVYINGVWENITCEEVITTYSLNATNSMSNSSNPGIKIRQGIDTTVLAEVVLGSNGSTVSDTFDLSNLDSSYLNLTIQDANNYYYKVTVKSEDNTTYNQTQEFDASNVEDDMVFFGLPRQGINVIFEDL